MIFSCKFFSVKEKLIEEFTIKRTFGGFKIQKFRGLRTVRGR